MNDALKLIEHFERAACEDPLRSHFNPYGLLAIGYGHTKGVLEGQTLTREEADFIAINELEKLIHEIDALLPPFTRAEMSLNMRQAVASFAHSIGLNLFTQTSILTRLKSRRYCDVPKELLKFNHHEGRELRVLNRRRQSEAALFCSFPNWIVK